LNIFLEGTTTKENLPIKRFGYLISALLIIISTISMAMNWAATPWLFLITMYFLTGSLWVLILIKPFYLLFAKIFLKKDTGEFDKISDKDNKN
jgi:hypothetical protein